MSNDLPPMDKLISAYRNIRAKIDADTKAFNEEMVPLKAKLDTIDGVMLKVLEASGTKSMATESGTAFKKKSESIKVEDKAAFTQFVMDKMATDGADAFGYMTCAASKTVILEYMEDNEGLLPPGIKYDSFIAVQVRKPTKKAKK